MSHFQIRTIPGRVVLLHDMEDRLVISEMEPDQAGLLLEELQAALLTALSDLRLGAAAAQPAFL